MKKLSLFLAALFLVFLTLPANATITNGSLSGTYYGKNQVISPYMTAASLDTTATDNGNVIDNRDGSVVGLTVSANVTDKTGTSPTLQVTLQGSDDGTNFYTIDSQASSPAAIQTAATSISSAVTFGLSTDNYSRKGVFPAFLRWQVSVGGSSSPGWTGTIATTVHRAQFNMPTGF